MVGQPVSHELKRGRGPPSAAVHLLVTVSRIQYGVAETGTANAVQVVMWCAPTTYPLLLTFSSTGRSLEHTLEAFETHSPPSANPYLLIITLGADANAYVHSWPGAYTHSMQPHKVPKWC
ncbi:hypothetical protein, unlikely [Trypanosoma brucei gambiense DAL972]|uniref:Uncharacterized protein n=1 Tax=Trypanosoma brucei gambiense (strain MHOM/CI/86/DAL972) TaxID=679716 RepID=C9ZJR2_TRYB9|nr:hypothetical protein, unlikely [Trypanosoma brucei gambiense DAL972]CBH09622.1 hypothetical protein, unlikely [Trypanosoma brucei gambiense DAL972]|eukprot:XP_011771926.1 hypothetical protein, unlikely [Trypanosoma brucei gambiense DAL972]